MGKDEKIVYRLNSADVITEDNGRYNVRHNGYFVGSYSSLEKALESQVYYN